MNYDSVPGELKDRPQWVTWQFEDDPKHPEKPKKVPYNPHTGRRADTTNPKTWGAFAVALRAARTRKHSGVGFVFSPGDPFVGIDLDDCIDDSGMTADWAQEILVDMNSYSEISPSQHGIKLIVEGKLPEEVQSIKTASVEIYDRGRYFTITGQHVAGTPTAIRDVNGSLAALCARVRPQPEPSVSDVHSVLTARSAALDDEHVRVWAERLIDQACSMLALEPEGNLHNKRIDMGRWMGGLIPLGLATADELERRLYSARIPKSHHRDEQKAIRDGIEMGRLKPLEPPPAPPQPLMDGEGFACCPVHQTRLPKAKNGNGYKCHQGDNSTATGYCDFWWKGAGYVEPGPVVIAGEVITVPQEALVMTRYQLYRLSGLRALPPVEWLIQWQIPAVLFTVLCGPSGAGKSFLAVDYALRIARAFPDRAVVYIAAEGGSGYRLRADAWLAHNGGDEPQNIVFIIQAIPFLNPSAVSELIATIRTINPILVIADTLARCMVGGDENSAKDMGLFVDGCDVLRRELGTAILVLHHSGKSGTYRGSSALFGAADSWIDVSNDDGLITVSCGKAKDWEPFAPRYLRMVEVGESVVLLPSDQVSQKGAKLTEGQRKTLETLALDIFTGPGARRTELVGATGIAEPTMYKILSRLKREGFIDQGRRGDPYRITGLGLQEIKSYHRNLREQRQQEAELSNYQGTITNYPDSPITNYQTISTTPIGVEMIVDSDSSVGEGSNTPPRSGDDELFPDDSPANSAPVSGFDLALVRVLVNEGNMRALVTHYQLNRGKEVRGMSSEAILDLAEREATVQGTQ